MTHSQRDVERALGISAKKACDVQVALGAVELKCSLLFFSMFRTLGSSHSWSCPPCFFWRSHTYQHCDFLLGLFQLVYLHCSIWPLRLMQHSHPTLAFKPLIFFLPTLYLLALHPHHCLMLLAVFLYLLLLLPLPNSLRVLQWNAGGLRARSTELLHFILFHPVDRRDGVVVRASAL